MQRILNVAMVFEFLTFIGIEFHRLRLILRSFLPYSCWVNQCVNV